MAQLSQALKNNEIKYHKSTDSSLPKTMLYCFEGSTRWQSGPPIQICNKREHACEQVWEQKEQGRRCTYKVERTDDVKGQPKPCFSAWQTGLFLLMWIPLFAIRLQLGSSALTQQNRWLTAVNKNQGYLLSFTGTACTSSLSPTLSESWRVLGVFAWEGPVMLRLKAFAKKRVTNGKKIWLNSLKDKEMTLSLLPRLSPVALETRHPSFCPHVFLQW